MNSPAQDLQTQKSGPQRTILVVGDWVVDEHWVLGIHRSPIRSRTGQEHYRALHLPTSIVESPCGAGRTASVLLKAQSAGEPCFKVAGVGIWHEKDTAILTSMLDPLDTDKVQTPHQLFREQVTTHDDAGADLFNLANVIKTEDFSPTIDRNRAFGTTRMIRVYQRTGAQFSLLQRIDWEIQRPHFRKPFSNSHYDTWIPDASCLNDSELDKFIDEHKVDLAGVVIKDLRKGVVSKALIKWLTSRLDRIPWFISTKAWEPEWLDHVSDLAMQGKLDIRLFIIPQVAALGAVREEHLSRWVTRSGKPSQESLKHMDRHASRLGDRAIIIALPGGLSLLARDRQSPERQRRIGLVQPDNGPEYLVSGMPMASVLFGALVARMLHDERTQTKAEFPDLIRSALQFTYNWMKLEVRRVENPEEWKPSPDQIVYLGPSGIIERKPHDSEQIFSGRFTQFDWEDAGKMWTDSLSDLGIVTPRREAIQDTMGESQSSPQSDNPADCKYLELDRSMVEVDGYVCCTPEKKRLLQRIVNELAAFDHDGRKEHRSCMLIASPGSGKTHLVRCIADTLRLRFLGFNITQMISKSDLLDCFDTIVTYQAQNREKPLLVFVDEINSKLDGQHVYDAFLAPLEEHVYVRAGKTFHIEPCVWVFAGTEVPVSNRELSRDRSDKASDFESRLTIPPLNLKGATYETNNDSARALERVYMGVTMLQSLFPDVRKVSEKVLRLFTHLLPHHEARDIRHFVETFFNIQYGEVKSRNVLPDRLHKMCDSTLSWEKLDEGDMVEIRSQRAIRQPTA